MADQPLRGQRALVTGASSGIGLGVARALGAAGADVVVNYVSAPDAAEEVAEEIRAGGSRALAIRADVSREDQVQAMFREMLAAWGTIDILVNNAGLQKDAAFGEMTRRGPCPEVSRAVGKIICISSVHEVIPWAGHASYAASNGGVKLFMQTLAQELAPARIRVNSIAPGAIQTPINRDAWETPQALKSLLNLIPYGRIGQPEDVGRVAVFLASDDADYINGQTIFVDGGMTLYPEFARGG